MLRLTVAENLLDEDNNNMVGDAYLWWKATHIISVVTWMSGLFYLPRLFVYHSMSQSSSSHSQLLKVMERRLLRVIMYPSFTVVLVTGTVLLSAFERSNWMIAKLCLVGVLVVYHIFCAWWRVCFEHDRNIHSHFFYRVVNEIPTVTMAGIIFLVTLKPF